MRSWLVAGFLVAFFAGAVVPASALTPLSADLRTPTPLHVSGLVGLAEASDGAVALAKFPEGADVVQGLAVWGDRLQLVLSRWETPVGSVPLYEPAPTVTRSLVSHARLEVTQVLGRPQAVVQDGPRWPGQERLRGAAPECAIWNGEAASNAVAFPEGARPASQTRHGPGPGQIIADCRFRQLATASALHARLYGVELRLSSDEKQDLIRTGTFEEAVDPAGAVKRTVTQILDVVHDQAPFHVHVDSEARVRLYGRAFLAVGELRAAASEGTLAWGPLVQVGAVDPQTATGEYEISWAPEERMQIQGLTLEDPPEQASRGGAASRSVPISDALVASAVAAGSLFLLGRLLWALFARIPADRLLEHPRREALVALVRVQPGITKNAARRHLGITWINLVHHLMHLERAGLLAVRRVAGRTALFPARDGYGPASAGAALLHRHAHRRVYDVLRQEPGLDQRGIAVRTGLSRPRVTQVLLQLRGHGLVDVSRRGRTGVYSIRGPGRP